MVKMDHNMEFMDKFILRMEINKETSLELILMYKVHKIDLK